MAKNSEKILTVRERGQITLPFKFRKKLGIEENSLITITLKNGKLVLSPLVLTAKKEEKPEAEEAKTVKPKVKKVKNKKAAPEKKEQPVEDKQNRLFN